MTKRLSRLLKVVCSCDQETKSSKRNFLNFSLETKKHSKSAPIWKRNERLLFCCDDPILTVKSLKSGFNFVFNLGLRDLYTGQHTNQWSLINLAKATRLHHALELFGWSKPTRKIIPPVSSAYKSKCRIYNHWKIFSLLIWIPQKLIFYPRFDTCPLCAAGIMYVSIRILSFWRSY